MKYRHGGATVRIHPSGSVHVAAPNEQDAMAAYLGSRVRALRIQSLSCRQTVVGALWLEPLSLPDLLAATPNGGAMGAGLSVPLSPSLPLPAALRLVRGLSPSL